MRMLRHRQTVPDARAVKAARRRPRVLQLTAMFGFWSVVGVIAGLVASLTVPSLFGYRVLNVMSGSMGPKIETGSVVWDEVINPLDARVGDVVTFPDPEDRSRLITHRLRSIRVTGHTAQMVTRGDANDTVERWSVPVGAKLGRVVYHVPKLAYARVWISSHTSSMAAGIIVLVLILAALVEIWRPRGKGAPREIAL
jgi:signal peptidase